MRATVNTRLTLAGAAIAAAAALVSCGNTTGGTAVCPGCGTVAEPSFPTPSPSVSTSDGPHRARRRPPPRVPAETLPSNEQGYVYVETKSGKTRCELNSESVGCESQFENSPVVNGEPANGVSVTAGGTVRWIVGNLGDIPTVTLDYGTYSAAGWTIAADSNGTRFTNDATGHGMLVAVEGVQSF